MKLFSKLAFIALFTVASLTGCKHPAAPKNAGGAAGDGAGGALGNMGTLDGGTGIGMDGSGRPGGKWGSHGEFEPVYFDFDSSRVKPGEMSKIESVASALKGNSKKLVVEGHADERGTAEYNRALGERRAQACREELVKKGIAADRISTISYGEDRPAELGHDEGSWAKNRRCEFITVSQ